MTSRRGLALLVVVGVLGLLAVLGAAFVTMAQLERRASMQRLFATKALLLARSGIEDAMARLDGGQDPDAAGSRYGGEDWDASGTLNGFEGAAEAYRPGSLDVDACPVRQALRPSFFARSGSDLGADLLPAPARVQVEGRPRGYSGALGSDLVGMGNLYAVKVMPQAGIYINGGDPGQPANVDYNFVLRGILGNLAEALDREDGVNDGSPADQAFGPALINSRPPRGWESKAQVRAWAASIGKLSQWEALEPYVCLHAWVDRKVIRPNGDFTQIGKYYFSWADIKLDHETYPTLPGTCRPDFERIPMLPTGKVVGRAPVNLAWARKRKPVLLALLAPLRALVLNETEGRNPSGNAGPGPNGNMGKMAAGVIMNGWASADSAHRAADGILACTSDLGTWEAWDAFCDGVFPVAGLPLASAWATQALNDLLKANFNPNSRLNKFGPNASMWRSVDKSDLVWPAYSTEFSLLPVHDHEVTSFGRIVDVHGRMLAHRVVTVTLSGPSVVRLDTQREFLCEDLGDLGLAGDETDPRQPGRQPYVSMSNGPQPLTKTWGHSLGLPGLRFGAGLQTYPEPYVDVDGAGLAPLGISPADYDGSLQTATLETASLDTYTVASPPNRLTMLARYTAGMDLDEGAGNREHIPDTDQVSNAELGNGLMDPAKPNTLYPDGCYSESGRTPAYLSRDNLHGFHGLFSFWCKMNFQLPAGAGPGGDGVWPPGDARWRGRTFLNLTNYFLSDPGQTTPRGNQFFILGFRKSGPLGHRFSAFFEVGRAVADDTPAGCLEHAFSAPSAPAPPREDFMPHRWRLTTLFWDFLSTPRNDCGELVVDGGAAPQDLGSGQDYNQSTWSDNDPTMASDITSEGIHDIMTPGFPGSHRIYLGGHQYMESALDPFDYPMGYPWFAPSADATLDEFAAYDFGGAVAGGLQAPVTLASPSVLASERYREGRYYKGSAYAPIGAAIVPDQAPDWFSGPLDLGPVRLKALAWTQVVPKDLKFPQDPGVDARISIELSNAAGTGYLQDAGGIPIDATFTDSARSKVDRPVKAPFRLRAVFQPNLADPGNTPILDPLALDDVTILYDPPGGRRVLGWEEGAP